MHVVKRMLANSSYSFMLAARRCLVQRCWLHEWTGYMVYVAYWVMHWEEAPTGPLLCLTVPAGLNFPLTCWDMEGLCSRRACAAGKGGGNHLRPHHAIWRALTWCNIQ